MALNGRPRSNASGINVSASDASTAPPAKDSDIDDVVWAYKTARILPKIDIFNMLNSNDYTAVSTAQFGTAAYLRPSVILQGRLTPE